MKRINKHRCGDGFYGKIIRSHGVRFCIFCGKEVNSHGRNK